jgi:hypothetical protein
VTSSGFDISDIEASDSVTILSFACGYKWRDAFMSIRKTEHLFNKPLCSRGGSYLTTASKG